MKKQIIEKIKEYKTIIIHGHERPDGDCIGSQIGLKDIILTSYPDKIVYAVGPSSELVGFLGKLDNIEDSLYKDSLVIVVDTAIKERIADKRYIMAKEIIRIDHHLSDDEYGHINWVKLCPACTQMILELAKDYNLTMTKTGACALYTGLVTDTGGFRYDSVTGDTLRYAGDLLDMGISTAYVDVKLNLSDINMTKLKGFIFENFKTTEQGFAYIEMTPEIQKTFNVSEESAASMVTQLSCIKGHPIWALIMYYKDEIRLRIRSRGPRIDLLANKYGGGGHLKASGAKLNDKAQLAEFIAEVDRLLIEYKREHVVE